MKREFSLFSSILLNNDEAQKLELSRLPESLVLNEECTLVTEKHVTGKVIFRCGRPEGSLFEVRGTLTPGGDFLIMFPLGRHYGSDTETKVNSMTALRSHDGGRTWEPPQVGILDLDYNQHGFVPLIPKGSKRLYCFGTQPVWAEYSNYLVARENAPIGYFYSDDDGHTWTGPTLIRPVEDPGFRGMSVMRMCETDRGTWMIGAHSSVRSAPGEPWSLQTWQYVLRSEDQGRTWHVLPGARNQGWQCLDFGRMDEGRVLNLGNDRVLMMERTVEGHLWRSYSEDDGKTWTDPAPTTLVHPDAPPMVFPLSDGKTLVCFHHNVSSHSSHERQEIWVSFSADDGLTWTEPRFLFANAADMGNPSDFYNYQCSYLDMVEIGTTVHLLVPHLWHEVVELQIEEQDLLNLATTKKALFG